MVLGNQEKWYFLTRFLHWLIDENIFYILYFLFLFFSIFLSL